MNRPATRAASSDDSVFTMYAMRCCAVTTAGRAFLISLSFCAIRKDYHLMRLYRKWRFFIYTQLCVSISMESSF